MNRFEKAVKIACDKFDGHLTIMKFTRNWRVAFGTFGERFEISAMPEGKTFNEALDNLFEIFEGMDENARKFETYMRNRAEEEKEKFWLRVYSLDPFGL